MRKKVQTLISKMLTLWKSYRLPLIQTSPSPGKHWHWPCQTLQQGCLRMGWDGHDEGLHTNIHSEYHHRQHQTSWHVTDNLCILILFKYIEGWTKAAAKDGRVLYTSHKPWHKNQVWVNQRTRNNGQATAKICQPNFWNVHSIDKNSAFSGLYKSEEWQRQSALSGSCPSENTDLEIAN